MPGLAGRDKRGELRIDMDKESCLVDGGHVSR